MVSALSAENAVEARQVDVVGMLHPIGVSSLKYSNVETRPSRSAILGSQPNSVRERVISGLRRVPTTTSRAIGPRCARATQSGRRPRSRARRACAGRWAADDDEDEDIRSETRRVAKETFGTPSIASPPSPRKAFSLLQP